MLCSGEVMRALLDNVRNILASSDFVFFRHGEPDFVPPNPAHRESAKCLLEQAYYSINVEHDGMSAAEYSGGLL